MPRIPGTHNGGIPANLVWDENNPPVKCDGCGMVGIHTPDCDGKHTTSSLRQTECEMINKRREWARLGMSTDFIARDLFKMGNQIQALINILGTLVDPDELNDEYRRCCVAEMRRIRLANQDEIKRANLGIPPKSILGPDGQPL